MNSENKTPSETNVEIPAGNVTVNVTANPANAPTAPKTDGTKPPTIPRKSRKGKRNQPKVKLVTIAPPNYTREQLEAYIESQLTGKSCGKVFAQPIGETNFSDADRERIRQARAFHRHTLAHGPAKANILAEIRSPAWKAVSFRENMAGDRRGMRFFNPTLNGGKKKGQAFDKSLERAVMPREVAKA